MQVLRFAGPLGFLLSIPMLFRVSAVASLLTPATFLLALLVTEQFRRSDPPGHLASRAFRVLASLYIPLQLAVIGWAASAAASWSTSLANSLALAISVGACTGVFGMLAAHEMVHSRSRWERRLGVAMLFAMTYPHFRIAHMHGHHRHAATERDASTAHLGESFYHFLVRTIRAQVLVAWHFEQRRTRAKPLSLLHNRVVQGAFVLISLYVGLLFIRPSTAAFVAAQSGVAILVPELFNYVAHYGLIRHRYGANFEPLAGHHSWNSSGFGNFLIFNMGRHSDHHRRPAISYERLLPEPRALELPYGYAGAILVALVPPLWRAVMDHRIQPIASPRAESGYCSESPAAAMP